MDAVGHEEQHRQGHRRHGEDDEQRPGQGHRSSFELLTGRRPADGLAGALRRHARGLLGAVGTVGEDAGNLSDTLTEVRGSEEVRRPQPHQAGSGTFSTALTEVPKVLARRTAPVKDSPHHGNPRKRRLPA